ncbi:MAG: FUSC family protein [Phaeodactylibacter sp.]|nr:FUSC family protein [Phaeodactylibacter sp.]
MNQQETPSAAKSEKSKSILNAVLIGFLIGIVLYSIYNNSLGLLTLIPLFFIFRLLNRPQKDKD